MLPATRRIFAVILISVCNAVHLQKPREKKHQPQQSNNATVAYVEKHRTFTWGFVDDPSAKEAEDIVASITPGGVWMAASPILENKSKLALRAYKSKYGFYLHTFADGEACVHLLHEVRRIYPKEPIYIMSDGGMNFSGLCNDVGNCEFDWKPPANDRWNPVPFFHRFQTAARKLNTKFIIMLEPDNQIRSTIKDEPQHDAGGLNDTNPAFHAEMIKYVEAEGQKYSGNKDYHVLWTRFGLAGGSYFSTAAVLDAFDPDTVDWRMIRKFDSKRIYSSDLAMPLALACHGYTYYPWTEVTQLRYGLQDKAALRHYGRDEIKPFYDEMLSKQARELVTYHVPPSVEVICQGCMWVKDEACLKNDPINCPITGQDKGPPDSWHPIVNRKGSGRD